MFKISACLITKNEEKNIQRCIESFKEAVYETIVVDTGSTDQTIQLAQQLGAKVFHYEWNNHFADARNYALEKACGDWIIFLDADEYFMEGSGKKIPHLLSLVHENNKADALLLHHISIDEVTKRAIQSNSLVRIFRNNINIRYKNSIHESIYKKSGVVNLFNVSKKDLLVYHTGYSSDRVISKAERNLKMLLQENELGPIKQRNINYMYLSDCYVTLGQYDDAILSSKKFIESGELTLGFNTKVYHNIIRSMRAAGYPYEEKIVEIKKATERFPNHPDFYRYLAVEYLDHKQYDQALQYFQRTVELNAGYNDVELNTIPGLLTDIYYTIGRILELKNQSEFALDYYFKALTENKYHEGAFHCLIRLIKQESAEDIILFLKQLYDISIENDVQFVVRELSALKMGKTLLYFWNIWYKTYGKSDSTFMFALLGNKSYDEALRYFRSCYQEEAGHWAALFIVICILVSCDHLNNEEVIIIPEPYRRLCSVYYSVDKGLILGQEDFSDYLALLKELIILDEESTLRKLLQMKKSFDIPLSVEIGALLNDFNRFDLSLEQWNDSIHEKSINNEVSISYYEKAVCEYKLFKYKEAAESFQLAKEHGYSADEIEHFLYWMSKK